MSYIDARGAQLDIDAAASVGIFETMSVTSDGSARDLTNETITVVVKDDSERGSDYGRDYEGADGSHSTYSQTITDAAGGLFNFEIPASEFALKEGGRLTYEMYLTTSAGKRLGLMFGYLNVLERG